MKRSSGFTLIELLVSVTIFVGIMILALSIFSQTIASTNRSNTANQKTQAARSVVDQISNDFNYLALDQDIKVIDPLVPSECSGSPYCIYTGGSKLSMILKYPNPSPDNTYVVKTYDVLSTSDFRLYRATCPTVSGCVPTASGSVLSSNYSLSNVSIFSGHESTSSSKGYLTIKLSIYSNDNPGSPYALKTTLIPGGFQ